MSHDVLIVGAGITGLTIAERCADVGKTVRVVDQRPHIGGNCFDERVNGHRVHRYGPHVFHTASKKVVEYLSRFTEWRDYEHRVLADHEGKLLPIPVNATTLEMFFDVELPTEKHVERFLLGKQVVNGPPRNSEDVCLARVGPELYEALFKPYTEKQWGRSPAKLAPGVCGRIPVRFDRDDRYFTDWFQKMPKHGYTAMLERMIESSRIEVELEVDGYVEMKRSKVPVVWTGPLDQAFESRFGRLPWRSLTFMLRHHHAVRRQMAPVINRPSPKTRLTRTTEYAWLTGEVAEWTVIHEESPATSGEPYYPVPAADTQELAEEYKRLAAESDLIVCGRLGRYQYLEMGQAVASALKTFENEPKLRGAR